MKIEAAGFSEECVPTQTTITLALTAMEISNLIFWKDGSQTALNEGATYKCFPVFFKTAYISRDNNY
jgi:hypothetical protein